MTLSNNRIKSSNVQLGESFILGKNKTDLSPEQIIEERQKKQEAEFREHLEQLHAEASTQAKQIVEEALKQAEEIKQKAEQDFQAKAEELENLKNQSIENGYTEGYQKGYDDALNQARQDILAQINAINTLASAAFQVKKEIINSSEKEMLELSVAIAEKVIRQELEVKPELMQRIIRAAIEQLKDREEIRIVVNPALTQSIYEFVEGLKKTVKGLKSIKIIEDRTISKDGVIVESPESRIDARVETQLREIVKNIMAEYNERCHLAEIPKEIEVKIDERVVEEDEPR